MHYLVEMRGVEPIENCGTNSFIDLYFLYHVAYHVAHKNKPSSYTSTHNRWASPFTYKSLRTSHCCHTQPGTPTLPPFDALAPK